MAVISIMGTLCPSLPLIRRPKMTNGIFLFLMVVLTAVVQTNSDNVTGSLLPPASSLAIPVSTVVVPSTLVPSPSPSLPATVDPSPFLAQQTNSHSAFEISSSGMPYLHSMSATHNPTVAITAEVSTMYSTALSTESDTPALPLPSTAVSLSLVNSGIVDAVSPSPSVSEAMSTTPLSGSTLTGATSTQLLPSPVASQPATTHASLSTPSPTTPSSIQTFPGDVSLSLTPYQSSAARSVNATVSYTEWTPTQSLGPTPTTHLTPTPTTVSSTVITTAEPQELSLLEWFGIAVGGAAVLFISFLAYHCHQVRQRNVQRQKKEMKKEILHVDFSQDSLSRTDRVSSWRNSMALDAMATHIELPQEDSMDMQSMDNLGFEEVFLGDEPKAANSSSLLPPQTNL